MPWGSQGGYPARSSWGRGYPGGGYLVWGYPGRGATLVGGYPGGGGLPCQGGYPGRYPPARSGWGGTLPGGYPAGGGTQLGQLREYLLHGGRYASCVHAGGLSCCNCYDSILQ